MDDTPLSPIWVDRVIEKHHGPAAEVEAHLRAFGLSEERVAEAVREWAERHGVRLEGGSPPGEEHASDEP
jgi:hypothetical protein